LPSSSLKKIKNMHFPKKIAEISPGKLSSVEIKYLDSWKRDPEK